MLWKLTESQWCQCPQLQFEQKHHRSALISTQCSWLETVFSPSGPYLCHTHCHLHLDDWGTSSCPLQVPAGLCPLTSTAAAREGFGKCRSVPITHSWSECVSRFSLSRGRKWGTLKRSAKCLAFLHCSVFQITAHNQWAVNWKTRQ